MLYPISFENIIQEHLQYISEKDYQEYILMKSRKLNKKDEESKSPELISIEYFQKIFSKKNPEKIFQYLGKKTKEELRYLKGKGENKIDYTIESSISINSDFFKNIKKINLGVFGFCLNLVSAKKYIVFPFTLGPFDMAISIILSFDAGICINLGFDLNWEKKEYSFYIDAFGKAEPSITIDFGIYYKFAKAPVRMSLNIGMTGVIVSGKAGIKLDLYLADDKFQIDIYSEFTPFEFSFYIMFRLDVEINLGFMNYCFSFQFYIYQKVFFGLTWDNHIERKYKYNREKIKK